MAKQFWKANAPTLYHAGLLTKLDLLAFEELAECFARLRQARDFIAEHGMTYINSKGHEAKHPMVSILNTASRDFSSWSAEFGMTPSTQRGLSVTLPKDDNDDWADF